LTKNRSGQCSVGQLQSQSINYITKALPELAFRKAGALNSDQGLEHLPGLEAGNLRKFYSFIDTYSLRLPTLYPGVSPPKRVNSDAYFEKIVPSKSHRDIYFYIFKVCSACSHPAL
jgi:hypothetical protein